MRGDPSGARTWLVRSLMLGYLAIGLELTLFQFHQPDPGWNAVPGRTIVHDLRKGGIEFAINTVGNVVAAIPFGFLAPLAFGRRVATAGRVAAATCGGSLLIEASQAWTGRRVADVDDLILNTLGGVLGFGLLLAWRRFAVRRRSGSGIPAAWPGGGSRTPPPGPP